MVLLGDSVSHSAGDLWPLGSSPQAGCCHCFHTPGRVPLSARRLLLCVLQFQLLLPGGLLPPPLITGSPHSRVGTHRGEPQPSRGLRVVRERPHSPQGLLWVPFPSESSTSLFSPRSLGDMALLRSAPLAWGLLPSYRLMLELPGSSQNGCGHAGGRRSFCALSTDRPGPAGHWELAGLRVQVCR